MLGHQLLKQLVEYHDVRVTVRQDFSVYSGYGLFTESNTYSGIDVRSVDSLLQVITDFRPQVIINAVGIVKQRSTAKESIPSIEVNALLPHRLAAVAKATSARLIHFSTDCVFSGRKGSYTETDDSDAKDLYGRSKYLGEVSEPHCLTLRTSIIGRELTRKTGLVEWFLAQSESVRGYRRAIYSGFTTNEMSRIVEMLITRYPDASGVWHVSSDQINKCDLLNLLKQHYGRAIEVIPDDDFICDRSLDSSHFRSNFNYRPPRWESMIKELALEH